MPLSGEQIGANTWRIVEDDPYGQYPFIYVIMGSDKCIVIDTGVGKSNLREYIEQHINRAPLPYLVVCTHVHYDHVGGVYEFATGPAGTLLDVCMGAGDMRFSKNYELTSLCASVGHTVKPYTVTRWLKEGELLYLNESNAVADTALQVIFTPGHTLDSISLYDRGNKRLFIGDLLYPFTAVALSALGHNLPMYLASLKKLQTFVADPLTAIPVVEREAKAAEADGSTAPAPAAAAAAAGGASHTHAHGAVSHEDTVAAFCAMIGMPVETVSVMFDPESLLRATEWNMSDAICLFNELGDGVADLFPPSAKPVRKPAKPASSAPAVGTWDEARTTILLSAGHVEANMSVESLASMLAMMEAIRGGSLPPSRMEAEDTAEYTNGEFSVVLAQPPTWGK